MPRPAHIAVRRRRGFTLIELIVVVIIIAVLAAIAAVAYNQYAAKARSNAVLASASDLRTALMAAAARDDHTAADEAALLWDASGNDSTAFLTALSAHYDGPVTFTAAGDSGTATLLIGSTGSGAHTACLVLTEPPTVHAGSCDSSSTDPGAGGDPAPTGPEISDTFDRANASTLGTTSDGEHTWSALFGPAIGVSSQHAAVSGGGSGYAAADIPLSSADMDVTADYITGISGVLFRASDASHYWVAIENSGDPSTYLYSNNGALVAQGHCALVGAVAVHAAGSAITVTIDGKPCVSITGQTFNQAATGVGLWFNISKSGQLDNFTATPASDPSGTDPGATDTGSATTAPVAATGVPISTTNVWSTASTTQGLPGFERAQTAVIGNYVYLFGGWTGTGSAQILRAPVTDPTNWANTGKTLPYVTSAGAIAVLGQNVYIFGGDGTNRILSASTADPTTWTDTGKKLPVTLSQSQLAIVADQLYLFGGSTTSSCGAPTTAIYTAPVSDPTSWSTVSGKTLPGNACWGSLYRNDTNLYLVGAFSAGRTIYTAPVTDPTSWADTGKLLPVGSSIAQTAVIGSSVYLFGGWNGGSTTAIYSAPLTNPTAFTDTGKTLPFPLNDHGMFAFVGDNMYLFGGYSNGTYKNTVESAPITRGESISYNSPWIDSGGN